MTLWEFACARSGFDEAHGVKPKGGGEISDDRLAEMGVEGF